jgi:hypothetical protein
MSSSREQKLYNALRRIAKDYQTPDQLRRTAEREYGLRYHEALEYAYENILNDARQALRGIRMPKPKPAAQPSKSVVSDV